MNAMFRKGLRRLKRVLGHHRLGCVIGMVCLLTLPTARADLLEDIETRTEQGTGEIRLIFSVPVRYLNHFPADQGELLKIYLQTAGLDNPAGDELHGYKRAPTQIPVPSYAITYTTARNCYAVREPLCLDVQFSKPVKYRLLPGEDGHSLIILILPEDGANEMPAKP